MLSLLSSWWAKRQQKEPGEGKKLVKKKEKVLKTRKEAEPLHMRDAKEFGWHLRRKCDNIAHPTMWFLELYSTCRNQDIRDLRVRDIDLRRSLIAPTNQK